MNIPQFVALGAILAIVGMTNVSAEEPKYGPVLKVKPQGMQAEKPTYGPVIKVRPKGVHAEQTSQSVMPPTTTGVRGVEPDEIDRR